MKLSTNFTLFGLNVKAIQAYLKEQAKDRRGVRITCRGDLVYIITAYTAFKLPSVLYADVIQPVTFRECPADGVTIISAQYGFEVEENAPDLVDIFKRHAPNEKPVERTPFLQDIHKAAGQFHLPVQRRCNPEQPRSKSSFRHFPCTVCVHCPECRRIQQRRMDHLTRPGHLSRAAP